MNANNQNRNAQSAPRRTAPSNTNRPMPHGAVRRTPSAQKKPTGIGKIAFWHCAVAAGVFWELLLYCLIGWNGLALTPVYLILTGAAVGLIFGGIYSVIPNLTARKIYAYAYFAFGAVLFLVQYFVRQTFQTFMTFKSLISESANAVGTFSNEFWAIVTSGWWIILLYFLPLIAFAVLVTKKMNLRRLRGKLPLAMVALALVLELVCIGVIAVSPAGREKMGTQYLYDSAVNCFGLNNAMLLDTVGGLGGDDYVPPMSGLEEEQPPVDTDAGTDTGNADEPPAPSKVYERNELDIDFAALAESEKNKDVAKLHSGIASLSGSYQNEFTGMFKGKNLILIAAEGFSAEVIDPVRTPTLYRLANNGVNFTDYYQPVWGGSTLTGEASILTGLIPMGGVSGVKATANKNMYMTIGNSLMREGYFSRAFHNNSYTYYSRNLTHENFGYEKFIGYGNGIEVGVSNKWPQSDLEMMETTVDWYIDHQPFSVYYMTVSGHCNYNWTGNSMSKRNKDAVADMNASETIKAYHASQLELEKAMTYLVQRLEEAGIADDTLIVLSSDHYPYGLENGSFGNTEDFVSELYGYTYQNYAERDHSRLIMWSGVFEKMEEKIVIDAPTYSVDILPTLLNLFGVEFDSRLLAGRDVFSGVEALVCWTDYSWKTERGYYDSRKGKFTPDEGYEMPDDDYIKRIKSIVSYKINFSKTALNVDYYNKLFG